MDVILTITDQNHRRATRPHYTYTPLLTEAKGVFKIAYSMGLLGIASGHAVSDFLEGNIFCSTSMRLFANFSHLGASVLTEGALEVTTFPRAIVGKVCRRVCRAVDLTKCCRHEE